MKTRLVVALLLLSLMLCACGSTQYSFFQDKDPAESAPAQPAAPTPTTEIIVITPSPATPAPATPAPATPAPPTPAPPTPAPATPVPTTPASPSTNVTLTANLQYRINIFLSNFSEQGFGPFDIKTASDDQMMAFVHIYCKINNRNAIHYEGSYETIYQEDMNAQLLRFFNVTRYPYENASYLPGFTYHDGRFWFPAADGESYNKFTVVDSMVRNSDGTYTVQFQIYELGLEEYWNTPGVDNSFYWLNSAKVADMVWGERVTPIQGGTAVVRDYTKSNGIATYQLISYDVWDIEFSRP